MTPAAAGGLRRCISRLSPVNLKNTRFLHPFSSIVAAVLLAWPAPAPAAEAGLPFALPPDTALVFHVRDLPGLMANWERTPFARTWREPEVQRFFQPLRDQLGGDNLRSFREKMLSETGASPEELLALFTGEVCVAIVDLSPYLRDEEKDDPQVLVAAQIGDNVARFEEIMRTSAEKAKDDVVEEEFQGETLHVTMKSLDDGSRTEGEAWAIVDGCVFIAEPKPLLQAAISRFKKKEVGDSLAGNAAFADIYRREPQAQFVFHVDLATLVPRIVANLEAARDAGRTETGPGEAAGGFDIPPGQLVHALGLDALTSLYLAAHLGSDVTQIASGLTWTEQRGLLRLFAYGDPPAPQPAFVPDAWPGVGSARFDLPAAYRALKDTLRDVSPELDAQVQQQIDGVNKTLGIDIERDLIGSLGDEIFTAYTMPAPGAAQAGPRGMMADQLIAFSLGNPDAFKAAVTALMDMVPAGVAKQIVPREYLGETINAFVPRGGAAAGAMAGPVPEPTFAYAITRTHLFLAIGSPAMLEAAIQGGSAGANPFWTRPEVVAALGELPPGASSVAYYDLRRLVPVFFDTLAATTPPPLPAAVEDDDDGEEVASPGTPKAPMWDPAAKPSPESVEKHWGAAAAAVYREPRGIRGVYRIKHVE